MNVFTRLRQRVGKLIGWAKRHLTRSEAGDLEKGVLLLRDIAKRRSSPVPDVASRAQMSMAAVVGVLAELEQRGLVRLSKDKGASHTRVVAITRKGRAEAKR
ncbi:MAG TPA: hypothetical protein VIL09_02045 [Microvirga sp.]|jgi:DNA-binding MarR family transcriptional regulator